MIKFGQAKCAVIGRSYLSLKGSSRAPLAWVFFRAWTCLALLPEIARSSGRDFARQAVSAERLSGMLGKDRHTAARRSSTRMRLVAGGFWLADSSGGIWRI